MRSISSASTGIAPFPFRCVMSPPVLCGNGTGEGGRGRSHRCSYYRKKVSSRSVQRRTGPGCVSPPPRRERGVFRQAPKESPACTHPQSELVERFLRLNASNEAGRLLNCLLSNLRRPARAVGRRSILVDHIKAAPGLERLHQGLGLALKLVLQSRLAAVLPFRSKEEPRLCPIRLGRRRTAARPADGLRPFCLSHRFDHTRGHESPPFWRLGLTPSKVSAGVPPAGFAASARQANQLLAALRCGFDCAVLDKAAITV